RGRPGPTGGIGMGLETFSREEVEAEFWNYVRRGEAKDWSAWADQFTEDALYVEHEMGTFRGREEIRRWIVPTMEPVADMEFPVEWHLIEGERVVFLAQNRLPHPGGSGEPFQFASVSVLHYAGGGRWSYEEDIYNAKEAERVLAAYAEAASATQSS
ncbi:MAG: nuclear transport factor 2 family protein, partial [Acidimicrobiales bacterium]